MPELPQQSGADVLHVMLTELQSWYVTQSFDELHSCATFPLQRMSPGVEQVTPLHPASMNMPTAAAANTIFLA